MNDEQNSNEKNDFASRHREAGEFFQHTGARHKAVADELGELADKWKEQNRGDAPQTVQ